MAGELPEEVIQHIQSFLDAKDAVRTSTLSKEWYKAWHTHPILSLDERVFLGKPLSLFRSFARTSMARYQNRNPKLLYSFRLSFFSWEPDAFADMLISDALALGVRDLRFDDAERILYSLPPQVFHSMSLKELYIRGCRIKRLSNIPFNSRIVSLSLNNVSVGNDMMSDVLSGCQLIVNLVLYDCLGLEKVNLTVLQPNLKSFRARSSLGYLLVEWEENNAPEQHQYRNLISLELLDGVEVDDLFFSSFSHRFPCLNELTLANCNAHVDLEFASNSLRYLRFVSSHTLAFAKFHVPNIRSWSLCTGDNVPYISLSTASAEWRSDLKFVHLRWTIEGYWFMKIRDILTELRLSKIHLVIDLSNVDGAYNLIGGVPSIASSPFVENLKILIRPTKSGLLGVLFGWWWCCRPKFITWINAVAEVTSYETPYSLYTRN